MYMKGILEVMNAGFVRLFQNHGKSIRVQPALGGKQQIPAAEISDLGFCAGAGKGKPENLFDHGCRNL